MQVHFHRTDGSGGYAVLMRRDDGLTVRLPGLDQTWRVPHDLVHFVAEREFRLGHGVFGSIAAGAMFANMAVVSGRPRYDAKVRSRAVIKAYAAELSLAEVLSGVVHDGVEHEVKAAIVYRQVLEAWGSLRSAPCPYQAATLRRCLVLLDALDDKWRAVAVGDRLALRWELPGGPAWQVAAR
ncbi:hypothetical protein GCM10023322_49650 [Rugosimonospora acidiphila]|uniref:Uncharacterized protein n=1 Tax=Rugosimonospora acidiphila TaxID=556531 RepID=A0ABP9S5K6_9ACTN